MSRTVDRVYCGYPGGRPVWPFSMYERRIVIKGAPSPMREATTPANRQDKGMAKARRFDVIKAMAAGATLVSEIAYKARVNQGTVREILREFVGAGLVKKSKAKGLKNNTLSFALTAKGRAAA